VIVADDLPVTQKSSDGSPLTARSGHG
jgi:hypothetical protein